MAAGPGHRAQSSLVQTIDRRIVAKRDARLRRARKELKDHFIGIDGIIDELVDAVRLWYVAPQLVTRPVVVGLWGMTGVGKTDLVRRLVAALDLDEHFVELEPANGDETTDKTSVVSRLERTGALEGTPTVILVDEIQRLRTIDERGDDVGTKRFQDLWQLLSDGRLTRTSPAELDDLEHHLIGWKRKARIGVWYATRLKRELRLAEPVRELARLRVAEAHEVIAEKRRDKAVFRPLDCTRSLVVVCGNLDDAYGVATQASEADIDADSFADMCERVTAIDVKDALLRRFRPEQVARFGNTHLVYPSLRREHFERLIARELDRVAAAMHDAYGVQVVLDSSVHELVYRNGVFPVQGVRPVLSTVADVVEANLSGLLLAALSGGHAEIALSYDPDRHVLVAVLGDGAIEVPYEGRLDRIRSDVTPDRLACVAVHEAGHALVHCLELGVAPQQVICRVASSEHGGFTFGHGIHATKASMLAKVRVQLAGGLAEALVFGDDARSTGAASDREAATQLVVDHVRRHGFDPRFPAVMTLDEPYDLDRSGTSEAVVALLDAAGSEVARTHATHRRALVDLAGALADAGRLGDADVVRVLTAHGIEVRCEPGSWEAVPPYAAMLAAARAETDTVPV